MMLSLGMNKLHCVYSCLRGCPRVSEEGIKTPGAVVTGDFEPLKVESGDHTLEPTF